MQRAYGLQVPQNLQEACDPQRLALIVYDMQVGILSQMKDSAVVTASVGEVLRAARGAGIRVIFSRHRSLPKELMGVFQLRMASLRYAGDALFTNVAELREVLHKSRQ